MFIVELTYKVDLDVADRYMDEHRKYVKKHQKEGVFLAAGRKNPRTGGIIIADASSKISLSNLLKLDPFYINGICKYFITEFEPTTIAKGVCLEVSE